jgi:hypothetical protein
MLEHIRMGKDLFWERPQKHRKQKQMRLHQTKTCLYITGNKQCSGEITYGMRENISKLSDKELISSIQEL